MTKQFAVFLAIGLAAIAAKSLAVKDLPAAVQKTVQEQAKGAEIKNIAKETEKGVTQYEVETIANSACVDGKLGRVETFTRGGETMYEAAYTTKAGKKLEVLVKADGTETKD